MLYFNWVKAIFQIIFSFLDYINISGYHKFELNFLKNRISIEKILC